MAGSLNKVQLIGTLGRDPEIRNFQNGGSVCNLSVATSQSWKDKNTGERRENTQWHNVAIFNPHLVKVAMDNLKKGSRVYVEGQIETRSWEKDGEKRNTTEIVLRPYSGELMILSGSKDKQETAQEYAKEKSGAYHKPLDDDFDSVPF